MKLKGDLDSIGLAELFKTLADQKANGILSVTSAMGEKHVSIQQGALSIISDRLAERTRLGDLLVARGHLTESQLLETLKNQRQNDPHTKLGDLLVKKNIVAEEKITEALRFQLEEELYDLFTWKGASFEFDSDKGVDDVAQRGGDNDDLHHLSIDAQAVIAEASARMAEWKDIQQRLPTPYLCFKISPKGDELMPRATRSVQIIVKLLKEGRTLETTVKRSCLGRFSVCKSVIKLLDDGWIFPYPTSELRMLASEHRAQKRFADALNIYRRLLEATEAEAERQQLQQLIDDTIDSILRAREAGTEIEGSEIVSHKKAAEDYMRRQRNRRIMMAGFCVVSAAVIVVLLLMQYAPKAEMPQNYLNAIKASDALVSEGKYEEAMEIWDNFYRTLGDKSSDTAARVMERRKMLPLKFDTYVETLLQPLEQAEKAGKLDEAREGYLQLKTRYPRSPLVARMDEGLARVEKSRKAMQDADVAANRQRKLEDAKRLKRQKQYTDARNKFKELAGEAPADSALRTEAEAQLNDLAGLEEQAKKALENGETELKDKHAERAIQALTAAFQDWPDLPDAQKARELHDRLTARLNELNLLIKQAQTAREQGEVLGALEIIKRIEAGYPEFSDKVGTLARDIESLTNRVTALDRMLERAKAELAARNIKVARDLFAQLLRADTSYLAARKVDVPVTINSKPAAKIKIDGVDNGMTPRDLVLPAARGIVITLECDGFQTFEEKIDRLRAKDLEIHVQLQPNPVQQHKLKPGIFAPPRVIGDTVYIFNGSSLTAFNSSGDQSWNLDKLFDENAPNRPSSSGAGPAELVDDKKWWCPRSMPEAFGPDSLLLALRSRDLLEISRSRPTGFKRLVTTPTEPVGQPYIERNSKLAGANLVAVGCADGKVRCYDLSKPDAPLWEQPVDPANAAPRGTIVAGLSPRTGSIVVSLSLSGKLQWFSLLDGKVQATQDVRSEVSANTLLPLTTSENLAAIIHATGALTVFDLNLRDKIWELPVLGGEQASGATVDASGIFVVTTQGMLGALKKFSRERSTQPPSAQWTSNLDGPPVSNVLVTSKVIYVSTEENLYAISASDGSLMWKYHPPKPLPKFLTLHNGLLYLAAEDGRVTILKAE